MTKKSDVINSFIQAKKHKKHKLTKTQTINRLLGAQVLNTNQIIKVSKLKNIKTDNLSRRTINHGFNKTIQEMRQTLTRPEQQASKVIHNRGFEIIALIINDNLLHPETTARALAIFFIANLVYYSVCIIYNYYYNPLVLVYLILISFIISLIIRLATIIFYKRKR